jgi:APA family basic amino acid/polyamine antiporter
MFSRVIYTEWIFFALMAAGLLRLRRRPDYRPSYRILGGPAIPVLFIAASAVVVVMKIIEVPADSAWGLGMVLAGLPVYLFWSRSGDRST